MQLLWHKRPASGLPNPRSDNDMGFAAGTMVLPSFHRSDYELDTDMDNGRSSSPSVTERKHEYRRLKPNEIRLLVLNPGLPDELIECFLEQYSVK
jgi:hypothetical protein